MQPGAIIEMASAEDAHWWFVATRDVIVDILLNALGHSPEGATLLDAGCGSGYTLTRMREAGFRVSGCDASQVALQQARRRDLTDLRRADLTELPYDDGSFDAVVCLDVLEHVQRDDAAAAELSRVLCPGGIAVIAVPAWPELYGPHDQALGHLRRYRRREFRAVLERGGFRVQQLTYYNSLLSPLVAAARLWARWRGGIAKTDVSLPPKPINALLRHTLASERWWLRRASLPLGISLLAVARRA